MKTYITLRGVVKTTRPMRELPEAERKEILIELQTQNSKAVRAMHNIDNAVISHLKWHCQHLLKGTLTPQDRIRDLRKEGFTSQEVAMELSLPLETVNELW